MRVRRPWAGRITTSCRRTGSIGISAPAHYESCATRHAPSRRLPLPSHYLPLTARGKAGSSCDRPRRRASVRSLLVNLVVESRPTPRLLPRLSGPPTGRCARRSRESRLLWGTRSASRCGRPALEPYAIVWSSPSGRAERDRRRDSGRARTGTRVPHMRGEVPARCPGRSRRWGLRCRTRSCKFALLTGRAIALAGDVPSDERPVELHHEALRRRWATSDTAVLRQQRRTIHVGAAGMGGTAVREPGGARLLVRRLRDRPGPLGITVTSPDEPFPPGRRHWLRPTRVLDVSLDPEVRRSRRTRVRPDVSR